MAIDEFIGKVEREGDKLDRDLYDEIMAIVIGLITVDGRVVRNAKNIRLINKVDSGFAAFDSGFQQPFLNKIKGELASLNKYYIDYFEGIGVDTKALRGFKTLLGNMNSYLDSVSLLEPVKQEVKQFLLNAISSHRSMGSIRSGLRDILGLKERAGALNRYYNTFLYDSIAQFDRIVSNAFAEQNDLNYFIYKGGLITDSREFCIRRDGEIFHRSEASAWKNDMTLPGYPNVADYDPLVELGRWNCRHYLLWITDEEAKNGTNK